MGAVRFEGVDILDSLEQIMELHTQHYKDDFDLEIGRASCREGV